VYFWSYVVSRTASNKFNAGRCKRQSYRKPTLIAGQVSTGDRSKRLDCRVLDMSATGARLNMDDAQSLPQRIGLFLDRKGTNVECLVVWRHSSQAGVRFCSCILPGRKLELF